MNLDERILTICSLSAADRRGYYFAGLPDEIKKLVRDAVEEVIGEDEKIVQIQKPRHGTCCTCQECGLNYDDCECGIKESHNEFRSTLRTKAKELGL